MKLVIVESPTKARKLKGYLDSSFAIEASVGHVRDLPRKEIGVDVEKNFEPKYEVSKDKSKVLSKLKTLAKRADTIVLATDPDREGEAIAWHVKHILETAKGVGKKDKDFVRSTFHEITKPAVLDAINNPKEINMNLVDAQQARRIVDRLVGYEVSPVLWRKVRRGLSAGRVQSVALRLIVEREREIEEFKPEEYWELDVAFHPDHAARKLVTENSWVEPLPDDVFVARVVKYKSKAYSPKQEADVTPLVQALPEALFTVSSVEKKQRKRSSLPPFTTSTLQQAASTRLGMSSRQTMTLAQQLYEEGLITYHRTDSVSLSGQAISMAREYIAKVYGSEYVPEKPRVFRSSSKNAQEAHEAIRVTEVTIKPEDVPSKGAKLTARHGALYDLIRRRFLASQMPEARYDQTTILISAKHKNLSAELKTTGSILSFDGWMRLFPGGGDTILPNISQGQELSYQDLLAAQKFTQPPARYNDASLVKELEKRGIGRPSTYASIISVIVERGYVERESKRFFATPIGMTVSDFLLKHFPVFMEYDFTAEMEEDLDRIARGEKQWPSVVSEFYKPFHEKVEEALENAERAKVPVEKTGEPCPQCGKEEQGEIVIRSGRYGKFKSCSRYPECDFTENLVETVDDVVCPLCQKGEVVVKQSRWGKQFYGCRRYPDCEWASWKKPEKGETITAAEWKEHQAERKKRAEARKKKFASKKKSTPKKKTGAKKSSAKKK